MSGEDAALDVGSWFATLARNWWVILGLAVLGAVVGAVVTIGSADEYTATSAVYIGQTTDANGNPMPGLNSNARAATEFLASNAALAEAAELTGMGMSAGSLGEATLVETPSGQTSSSAVNIVVMSVTDESGRRAAAAANALADVLVANIAEGVEDKVVVLKRQLADGKTALAASVQRSTAAQKALRSLARESGGRADPSAAAPYVAIAQAAASEQQALQAANTEKELMLLVARDVERPRLLYEAGVPDEPSGPSLALNVAAGALAGLVVGVLVAFVRRRFSERA